MPKGLLMFYKTLNFVPELNKKWFMYKNKCHKINIKFTECLNCDCFSPTRVTKWGGAWVSWMFAARETHAGCRQACSTARGSINTGDIYHIVHLSITVLSIKVWFLMLKGNTSYTIQFYSVSVGKPIIR